MAVPNQVFRVHVSGLAKTVVNQEAQRIREEDNLGLYFLNHGCNIMDVRLMVDLSSNKCRGFGFVDFQDEDSLNTALKHSGCRTPQPIVLDPGAAMSTGLVVAKAKPASEKEVSKHRELTMAMDVTEGLERNVRWHKAKVNELRHELDINLARQHDLEARAEIEVLLAAALAHQEHVRLEVAKVLAEEQALREDLHAVQERTSALEKIQQQTGLDGEGDTSCAEATDVFPVSGSTVLEVRRTFLEYDTKWPKEPLFRCRTAPAADAGHAEHQAAARQLPAFQVPQVYSEPPPPWLLKRQLPGPAGPAVIARKLLETKMEAETAIENAVLAKSLTGAEVAVVNSQPALKVPPVAVVGTTARRWSDESEGSDDGIVEHEPSAGTEAEGQRTVRIRNLPLIPGGPQEVKKQLQAELARLYRSGSLAIESITMQDEADPCTEALVTFVDPSDASWLVDCRHPANWCSAETLSLHGHVLQAEWPAAPPSTRSNWRHHWKKLRYKADTEVSSQISYATDGTKRSFEVKRDQTRNSGNGRRVQQHPTITLSGIDTSMPSRTARDKVLELLQRLWQQHGMSFEPNRDLHGGIEGIVVKETKIQGEENGGTCILRLMAYVDAKWLVDQRKVNIGSRTLKAMWAKPKGN